MAGPTPTVQTHWSSRFAFLMAAIGSAVGLGNLWRFPFMTGQYGGSAFVLVYLLCVVLIALPILIAELSVGRHKGLSAVGSTRNLAIDAGRSPRWAIAGWVGMTAGFLVLTTYSVIAGQVMAYSAMSFLGEFASAAGGAGGGAQALYATTGAKLWWHAAFMVITVGIVARGLTGGIEKVVTVLMPMFFVMLTGLCVYALVTGAAGEALAYMFRPDFAALRPETALAALGQAFFSIGVGGAIMITYGSYLERSENIPISAGVIAGADTLVAVVAGLMIFPVVFAFGLDPNAGGGLIFDVLPNVFADMPAGSFVGGLFFFLAFIAALTSSISLMQVVASFAEEHTDLSRTTSVCLFGGLAWFIGAGAVFSGDFGGFVDFVSGSVVLPLGGLLISVFAGWVVPAGIMRGELPHASPGVFAAWRFMVRYPVPLAVGYILLSGLNDRLGIFGGS